MQTNIQLRSSCCLQARHPAVLCKVQPIAARTFTAKVGRRRLSRPAGAASRAVGSSLRAWGQPGRRHGGQMLPTNTAAAVGAAGQTFAEPAVYGEPDISVMKPYVGHVAVHVAPGEALFWLVDCAACLNAAAQINCSGAH